MKNTKQWFEAAVPNPTAKNLEVQLGCHLEEVSEMMVGFIVESNDSDTIVDWFKHLAMEIDKVASELKQGKYTITNVDANAVLDGITDQQVTAIGIGHMLGMDTAGALAEVDRSNFSKFGKDGQPIFDENGKIKKGPHYVKPNLEPFLPSPERIQQVLN